MVENELIIKFGGDGNINVDTLTNFLEIYKDLIFTINGKLGYSEEDLTIEVSPPENGSFKIKISPKYKKLLLRSFETIVVSTLGGLILFYATKSNEDQTLEEIRDLLIEQNAQPDVINNVYNVYLIPGTEQKIQQSFSIVDNDENVTSLQIDQNDKNIVSIPRSQFSHLSQNILNVNQVAEPQGDILTDEAQLILKTIHFEGNAKWAFVFRGYPIKASMKDQDFLNKLASESFKKGDILRVQLSRKRVYDEDLQTYIVDQNSYVIEKVNEHKSKTDNQSKLDLK